MMASEHRSAVVASRIYAPEGGAAAFRLAALVRQLDEHGYRTTVLTSQVPGRIPSTGRVRRMPVLRDRTGAVRGYLQYASFDIPLFFRLLSVRKPDVVIVEPPPTTGVVCRVVCRLRRVPYVYFSADVAATAAEGIGVSRAVVRLLRRVESWVLRGARLVLAVSEGVRDEVVGLGAPSERVEVVGTGVDTQCFSPDGTGSGVPFRYFVYAGTMSEIQGAEVFVDAFAGIADRFPDVRLVMFGQGVEVERLKNLAATKAAGRVDFRGPASGEVVAGWLRGAIASLASVRPNRGYDFAFATKAFASVACGTPVIYAGVGPVRDHVKREDLGWAVGWDPTEVARAMEAALATGRDAMDRDRLARWAEANASLNLVGDRAARAIDRIVPSKP